MKGKLFVISGPSGVGKSTVIARVTRERALHFSISATTREQRPGEMNGKHYYFVERAEFEDLLRRGELLEHAEYVGNYYGTPHSPVEEALESGRDVLLDVEVQGALQVREKKRDAVLIFLTAPSFRVLEQRLTSRGDTSPEFVMGRLKRAREEYLLAPQYDYLVINDDVEHAAAEILAIMTAETCRMRERAHLLKED